MTKQLNPDLEEPYYAFLRNGRWGTCIDCPRHDGHVWPEECIFTKRSDHHLDHRALAFLHDAVTRTETQTK